MNRDDDAPIANLHAWAKRELEAATDENGNIRLADAERINARLSAGMDALFEGMIERLHAESPAVAEAVRAHLAPLREMLKKSVLDMIAPH